jgi:hypothetical protein
MVQLLEHVAIRTVVIVYGVGDGQAIGLLLLLENGGGDLVDL